MVPKPLNCAFAPEMTSEEKSVLLRLRFAIVNFKLFVPEGRRAALAYLTVNPKAAVPFNAGLATYEPAGELIDPEPATYPSVGSNTTTNSYLLVAGPPSLSMTVTPTE